MSSFWHKTSCLVGTFGERPIFQISHYSSKALWKTKKKKSILNKKLEIIFSLHQNNHLQYKTRNIFNYDFTEVEIEKLLYEKFTNK